MLTEEPQATVVLVQELAFLKVVAFLELDECVDRIGVGLPLQVEVGEMIEAVTLVCVDPVEDRLSDLRREPGRCHARRSVDRHDVRERRPSLGPSRL
jgi:hypothetical protein